MFNINTTDTELTLLNILNTQNSKSPLRNNHLGISKIREQARKHGIKMQSVHLGIKNLINKGFVEEITVRSGLSHTNEVYRITKRGIKRVKYPTFIFVLSDITTWKRFNVVATTITMTSPLVYALFAFELIDI